jgi:hypothetical protein
VKSDPTEVHDMPTSDPEVQRMMGAAGFEDVSISHDPAFGASLSAETART